MPPPPSQRSHPHSRPPPPLADLTPLGRHHGQPSANRPTSTPQISCPAATTTAVIQPLRAPTAAQLQSERLYTNRTRAPHPLDRASGAGPLHREMTTPTPRHELTLQLNPTRAVAQFIGGPMFLSLAAIADDSPGDMATWNEMTAMECTRAVSDREWLLTPAMTADGPPILVPLRPRLC